MRELLVSHNEILKNLEELNRKEIEQDEKILVIFEYLKRLEEDERQEEAFRERRRVGFKQGDE